MKSALQVLACNRVEGLWDEYFLLLMRRYDDLGLPYPFDMTFSFIGNPIISGNALIARKADSEETIGALGFVFGTGEDQYTDESVCQIEAVYVEPGWRQTKAAVWLLMEFVALLKNRQPPVERIQFWAPADRPDLHRLFSKFSDCIRTNEKSFGRISLYETTLERLAAYADRFRPLTMRTVGD